MAARNDDDSSKLTRCWYMMCARSCISCILLTSWLQKIVLNPMKNDAIEMAHMDPTDIVAVPMPLQKIAWFVVVAVVSVWISEAVSIRASFQLFLELVVKRILLSLLVAVLFILMGASPSKQMFHTLYSAIYTVTLAWSEYTLMPLSLSFLQLPSILTCSLFPPFAWDKSSTKQGVFHLSRLYGTLLVAIPFQVLQILDHGSQSQRWPLPIILGTTVGHVVGSFCGMIYASFFVHEKSL